MKISYTNIEAIFHNILITHCNKVDFNIKDSSCTLEYMNEPTDFSPALSTSIKSLQGTIDLELSSLALLSLHQDTKEHTIESFNNFPKELQVALLEFILEDSLKTLSEKFDTSFTFLNIQEENSEEKYAFSFKFSINEDISYMRVSLPASLITFLIPKLQELPQKEVHIANMPFVASFIVGSLSLPLQDVKDLKTDDVLLPSSLAHIAKTEEKKVIMRIIDSNKAVYTEFLCNTGEKELTILEKISLQNTNNKENTMENEEVQNNEEAQTTEMQATSINDLNMELSFEIDRKIMTLAEIQSLNVGTNILFTANEDSPITVNVLNTPFAKARIVEIDGNYALQITKILLKQD